jgi:uncharacterized membrane protein
MSDSPYKFIAASFAGVDAAAEELKFLNEGDRPKLIDLKDAAVIRKDEHGKLHISETADTSGKKGAVIGGALGGVLGLLAGPGAVVVGAAGAAIVGGLAAHLHDAGINNKALKEFGDTLQPDTSALILILGAAWVDSIVNDLSAAGGKVLTDSLDEGFVAQIDQDIQEHFKADKAVSEADLIQAKVQDARYKADTDIQADEARPMTQ